MAVAWLKGSAGGAPGGSDPRAARPARRTSATAKSGPMTCLHANVGHERSNVPEDRSGRPARQRPDRAEPRLGGATGYFGPAARSSAELSILPLEASSSWTV